MPLPPLTPCRVYVFDTSQGVEKYYARHYWNRALNWASGGFSTELHLQRALLGQQHPWRVHSPAEADVVFIAANFSQMCAVGKEFSARRYFNELRKDRSGLWGASSPFHRLPKILSLHFRQNCRLPWSDAGGLPRDTLVLTDQLKCKGPGSRGRRCCGCESSNELVVPFAITRPRWLVRGRVPRSTAWTERKLLFFGGHVPTLYNEPLRYQLWRQLRRDARVTTQSHTINCMCGRHLLRSPRPRGLGRLLPCIAAVLRNA